LELLPVVILAQIHHLHYFGCNNNIIGMRLDDFILCKCAIYLQAKADSTQNHVCPTSQEEPRRRVLI
jgi:hypothetical protein